MKRRFFMGIVLSAVLSLSCMGTACGHSGESEEMADRTEESIDGLTGTGEGMTSTGDGLNGTGNRSGESGQENNSPMDRAPGTLSELIDKYGTGFVYVSDGEFGGETLEVSIDVELPQAKQMDVVEIMPKWYADDGDASGNAAVAGTCRPEQPPEHGADASRYGIDCASGTSNCSRDRWEECPFLFKSISRFLVSFKRSFPAFRSSRFSLSLLNVPDA